MINREYIEYCEQFADKQSFETFIKDFNKRLTKIEKNTKVNRADYFLLEDRFRKLHIGLIKLNFDLDRFIHTTLKNIERLNNEVKK